MEEGEEAKRGMEWEERKKREGKRKGNDIKGEERKARKGHYMKGKEGKWKKRIWKERRKGKIGKGKDIKYFWLFLLLLSNHHPLALYLIKRIVVRVLLWKRNRKSNFTVHFLDLGRLIVLNHQPAVRDPRATCSAEQLSYLQPCPTRRRSTWAESNKVKACGSSRFVSKENPSTTMKRMNDGCKYLFHIVACCLSLGTLNSACLLFN